jgi:hypothetical protein
MQTMPDVNRDLGRHDAEIGQLKDDMRSMKEDVHEIKMMMSEARGGWKVILLISGMSATIGALLSKLIPWLTK